jgi:hypothetical protein
VSRNRSRASHRPRCSIQAGSGYHNGTLADHGADRLRPGLHCGTRGLTDYVAAGGHRPPVVKASNSALPSSDVQHPTGRRPDRRQAHIGPPKSDAGVRDVAIPPHLIPPLHTRCAMCCQHAAQGRDAEMAKRLSAPAVGPSDQDGQR